VLLDADVPEKTAEAIYHLVRGEQYTWDAQSLKHKAMRDRIQAWLDSVDNL